MKKILTVSLIAVLLLAGCSKKGVSLIPPAAKLTDSALIDATSAPKDEVVSVGQFKRDGVSKYAGNYYGVTYVKGYATTKKMSEPFCESNCKQYNYVNFNITGVNDPIFQEYLKTNEGNAYGGAKYIGLGCEDSNIISYQNMADVRRQNDVKLSKDLSGKILASTQAAPITLKLTKEKLTGGSGAPACYSHISKVEYVEIIKNATGFIEGSMGYPSEGIPSGVIVCAENLQTKTEMCTKKRVYSKKYTYGIGYKIEVPIGKYFVYERFTEKFADFTPEDKAFYSEFVKCEFGKTCSSQSHSPIPVTVRSGETVTGIDPQDWYKN